MAIKHHQNPRLMRRLLKDGRISLFLEYYFGRTSTPVLDEHGEPVLYTSGAMKGKPKMKVTHDRRKERLPYYLIAKPRTPIERSQNKEILKMAERIRFEKEQQMLNDVEGYRLKKDRDINFLDWMWSRYESYTKKDAAIMKMALNNFVAFLRETPKYEKYVTRIKPQQLTPDMVRAFTEWLQDNHRGEGAKATYKRFKKVISYAVEQNLITKDPCKGITISIDTNTLTKDVLSLEEVQLLANTHYKGEDVDVRRAFLFCCSTGMRWCDVKELTFANVDFSNRLLKFEQAKTKGHSSASGVVIPLSDDALLDLIGEPSAKGKRGDLIFLLPSYSMCLRVLRRWVSAAGIDKHITWHCARHSFAVNILNRGANIKVVASLLGHSGLSCTDKYTRATESLKAEAIKSISIWSK